MTIGNRLNKITTGGRPIVGREVEIEAEVETKVEIAIETERGPERETEHPLANREVPGLHRESRKVLAPRSTTVVLRRRC